jgi:type I restriction enzyme S subunit
MNRSKGNWTRVRFGDVVRLVRDRVDPQTSGVSRYVAGEHMETDDLRVRSWGEIGDGYLGPAFHMRFKRGHVLYGSRRTYLRKVAVAEFEGICANTTFVLESADPSTLIPELLPFVMQTEAFHSHSVTQSKGSVNPYVNFSDLAWYEFDLPPLDEQQRALRVLTANEETREVLRTLKESLTTVRFAQLNGFLRSRHSFAKPLGSVAQIVAGNTPSKNNEAYWGGRCPWASSKDLKSRVLEDTELHLTDSGWGEATVAPAGATLIVVRGMILAHTFPVTRCLVPMAFNQDLRALVAMKDLLPEYLTLWAEWMTPWFLQRTSESTHGTKRIESEVLREARIPIPTLAEQTELVSTQAKLIQAYSDCDARLSQCSKLRTACFDTFC